MTDIKRGVKPPHALSDGAFVEWLEPQEPGIRMQKQHRDRAYALARILSPTSPKQRRAWRGLCMHPAELAARARSFLADEVIRKINA